MDNEIKQVEKSERKKAREDAKKQESAVNNPIRWSQWVDPPRSSELCRLVSSVLLFLPFSDSKGRHRKQTDAEEVNPGRQTEVDVW